MLERWYRLKLWYTLTLFLGFILTFSLYTTLLTDTYILLQIEPLYKLNPNNFTYIYPTETLTLNDYTKLIDLNNFHFTIFNKVCDNETDTLLLILVHSSPRNFDKRRVIRDTWGQERKEIKLLFVLGSINNSTLQRKIQTENDINNDLLQGNFMDSYRNLTYKHVMVLKYPIYHCPEVKYVLKTDDDVFVNINATILFIKSEFSPPIGVSNLLLCKVIKNAKVFRSFRSKWRVSVKEYSRKRYPTYCTGFAILYSNDVLFQLYKNAQEMEYFWIDDVHITGDAVLGTNISHTDVSPLIFGSKHITRFNFNHFLYGKPQSNIDDILKLWRLIQKHSNET
nr:beta-1,3-galactosyltransferase 5-like [Onthophagus taurus]